MAAEGELNQDSSQRSLLLAIEAASHGKTRQGGLLPEVEMALRSAIRASPVRALINSYGGTLIHAAAYTPDGSALALGDSLGGVTLWDVATGLQRKALFAHVDAVLAIAFSPDGRKMATGSSDGKVVVWDIESATPLHVPSGHVDEVGGLAFSQPDGRLLATASDDASVRLWSVSAGTQVQTLYGHIGAVLALAFGRDERQLVTAGDDNRVVVWDTLQGRVLYSLPAQRLSDVDLSVDGSLLAVAAGDKVEIWDTATRSRGSTLTGHTNLVLKVRFSRDQRQVATASYDATVRVWRLPHGDRDTQRQAEEMVRFSRETMSFTSLAFSPTGDTVAASAIEGATTIWTVTGGGELLALAGGESAVEAVAFSPDGKTITAAGWTDGRVQTWDLSGKRVDTVFKDTQTRAKAVAFSSNGLLAVGDDKDVLVIQPGISTPLRLSAGQGLVYDLAFSPDGSRLVSASDDHTASVWELPSGKPLGALKGHKGLVFAVAYSPDAKTIATGSNDNIIRLWRADTREPLPELKGHFLGILDLAFTTDSRKLLSGSKDKTVRVWDVTTGVEEDVRRGHTDSVYAVAISGDRLATAADDGIRLWDLRSRAPVAVFPARSHGAQSLAFSLDGHYLAAGAGDGVVRVYEMQAEELVQLADTRVRRGWTNGECKQFLHRQFLPDIPCPRSRYSLLDEANQRFKNQELKDGERLLREAKGGGAADTELINAEVDARLGTALLWAANDAFERPAVWAEVDNSKKPEELAYALLVAAKEKSRDLMFDPQSRLNDLNAYKAVKLARELARADKLTESVAAFGQARAAGWDMPGEPERVASQLFALGVLSNPLDAEQVERALKLFPDIGPGHRLVAELYAKQNDFASAEKHYLEAASKESSAAPIASLAALSFLEYNGRKEVVYARKAAEYARKALDRDPGSDEAWVILGYAEYILKNEKKAVDAFDQVSPSSEFFADALNNASSIYFDDLGDDQTAYQRLRRAVELAPNDLMVLSSYAERLLASGRDGQAKVAATRRMSTLRPNAQTMPTFERR